MHRYITFYIKILCVVTLLVTSSFSYSQNRVTGRVFLAANSANPISNVRITLSNTASNAIVAYSFSKVDGTFAIEVKGAILPLKMEASAMGFKKVVMILNEWPNGLLLIPLVEGLFELNEVKVVAPLISLKGDTLNYMTSGFVKEGDRVIEDVLKRIPGIEVAASGEIRYNDVPINALYIDGKNILAEKYSIATKNLKPNLISMIQVFENHQPVKALKDFTPSESAAVNLKLSPEAKAEWIVSANLAMGFAAPLFELKPLYETKLLLFRFAPKIQTMNIIKGNNRGEVVQDEIKTQFLGVAAQGRLLVNEELNLINVTGVSVPPIGEERVLFNNGGYISSNSLFSVGEQSEISVKVNYSLEFKNREEEQYTTYLLNNSQIIIGEKSVFKGFAHRPEADLNFKSNREDYFLQSRVNFRGRFQDNSSGIYSAQNLNSSALLNQYDLSGIVTWIKPFGNSVIKVSSNNNISSLPQNLTISRQDASATLLEDSISQNISLRRILSNSSAEYTKRWGFFSAVAYAGIDLRHEQLSSEHYNNNGLSNNYLSGSGINNNRLSLSILQLSPSLRFDNKKLFIDASIPLKLINSSFRITPEFSIRYKISPFWEVSSSFISSVNYSDITSVYSNPIMINYRTYKSGADKISEKQATIFVARVIYNNPLKLVNLLASFSRSIIKNETTTHYNYFASMESLSTVTYMNISELFNPSQNSSSSVMLNFVKSFFDFPLLVNIKLVGIDSKSQMVQQDVFTENNLRLYSALSSLDFSIGSSVDITVKLPFSQANRKSISGVKASSSLRAFNPSMNTVLKVTKKTRVILNTTLNFNELTQGQFYLYPFADISFRLNLKKGEFFAEATNIFDNREYRYKIDGDLFHTEMLYKLRPFSFIAGFSFSF